MAVLANDMDVDGDQLHLTGASGGSATVNVSVTVAPVDTGNKRPILGSDATQVAQGKSVVIHPLANDFDPDNDALTITSASQQMQGTVTVAGDGPSLTYQAPATFAGSTSPSFSVSDNRGHVETGYVDVYVHMADNPDARPAPGPQRQRHHDARPAGDGRRPGQRLRHRHAPVGPFGQRQLAALHRHRRRQRRQDDHRHAGHRQRYELLRLLVPAVRRWEHGVRLCVGPGYVGNDRFTYVVSDGSLESGHGTVEMYVNADPAAQQAPVASGAELTTDEDTALTGTFSANDGADALTFVVVDEPAHGQVVLGENGAFTYTPAPEYSGPDTFTVVANDGIVDSAPATITVTVTPVNDAPVAGNDQGTAITGEAVTIAVRTNDSDVDGDTLTVTAASTPAQGTATVVNGGTAIQFISDKNFTGTETLTYAISDGHGGTTTATVTIQVTRKSTTTKPPKGKP